MSLPQSSALRSGWRCAAFLALCAALGASARAQEVPSSSFDLPRVQDTGYVENTGTSRLVAGSFLVSVPGADWLRLRFSEITLAGEIARGTESKLLMVSALDGGTQELNARHCREWGNTSAYFNGDAVEVEIVAHPGTGRNRAVLSEVIVGYSMQAQSQCGPVDDRVLSNDPRQARVLPVGCTTWIINDCNHCFLTAGHCATGIGVVEFNVPLSTSTGALNHPSPDDQYGLDASSRQYTSGGLGNDWCYYGCFANPNTGLTPYQKQQSSYVLAHASPPYTPGIDLRITGYGVDSTPNTSNQVQQTSDGPYTGKSGTVLSYQVDTTGGNSGSPVEWKQTGLAIGIHTNAGCSTGGTGSNTGTAVEAAGLQNALAHPLGVCIGPCVPSVSTYCTGKINSQNCTPQIAYVGVPSQSGGAGSFSINASLEINNKTGMLLYGIVSDALPFYGGTLCIGSPLVRTAAQDSGGTPAGDDCSGTYSYDMGARIASGIDPTLYVGTTAYAQYWSRDPGSVPFNIGLSNAVTFTIGP
jgi:V8-like Glu-specific endopeptidase